MLLSSITKRLLGIIGLILFLSGCATSGGIGGGFGKYSVGPERDEQLMPATAPRLDKPFMVVTVFDPNIPEDQDKIIEDAIWPEVRRTEAVRMSVMLGNKLTETNAFNGVRITPDTETSAHLYVLGKIVQSNGEELDLKITVVNIKGDKIFSKSYNFTVDEYALIDPRSGKEGDLYDPFFTTIANDIAEQVEELSPEERDELARVEELRYAEFFEPDYAGQYTETNWMGNVVVTSYPAENDPMIRRIQSLKVQDQMFIDNLQSDYINFYTISNPAYVSWQRAAFVETKAARAARTKANIKAAVGILALVGGVALASQGNSYDYGQALAGTAIAVGGISAISGAMGDSKQADAHRETLSELGGSLNIEIAPNVMELEETQVELKGTAKEQYSTWRSALKRVYEQESVPNIEL